MGTTKSFSIYSEATVIPCLRAARVATLPPDGRTTQVDGVGCLLIFLFVGVVECESRLRWCINAV